MRQQQGWAIPLVMSLLVLFIGSLSHTAKKNQIRQQKAFLEEFHSSVLSSFKGLQRFKDTNCAHLGTVSSNQLYPDFIPAPWGGMYDSAAQYNIRNIGNSVLFEMRVTFPDKKWPDYIMPRHFDGYTKELVNSRTILFSKVHTTRPEQARNNYNRTIMTTTHETGCYQL